MCYIITSVNYKLPSRSLFYESRVSNLAATDWFGNGVTVIWVPLGFRYPRTQIPSNMGIPGGGIPKLLKLVIMFRSKYRQILVISILVIFPYLCYTFLRESTYPRTSKKFSDLKIFASLGGLVKFRETKCSLFCLTCDLK